MSELVPVTESMFEDIRPALASFKTPPPGDPLWRNLLSLPWPVEEEFRGYALIHENQAVGFIGTIFSRRTINGRLEKFCNISSYVTTDEHRHESMALIKPLLALKNYTITNFTPTPAVYSLFRRLGFEDLDTTIHIILPTPTLRRPSSAAAGKFRVLSDARDIQPLLKGADAEIFEHHQFPHCWHLLIAGPDDYCYVVFGRTRGRKYSFSFVHYLSNAKIFYAALNRVKTFMALKSRTPFIMVMDRCLPEPPPGWIRTSAIKNKPLFKSCSLQREQIDSLYSELPLLNL